MVDTLLGQLKTKVHQGHRPCAHKAQHREGLEEESVDTEELAKLGTARGRRTQPWPLAEGCCWRIEEISTDLDGGVGLGPHNEVRGA
jgi:hypothetical protein